MLSAYERRLLAFYLVNAASRLHYRDHEASNLAEWVADRANGVSTFGTVGERSRASDMDPDSENSNFARTWRDLQLTLRAEHAATRNARQDRIARRLRRLGKMTGLTRTDVDILELLLRYQTQPVIEGMIDHVFGVFRRLPMTPLNVRGTALTSFLGVSARTVHGRLRESAPLVRSGLVSVEGDGTVNIVRRLDRLATAPGGAGVGVNRLLLDAASPSELEWSDFDHLARDRDHIERLLEGALETGASGVNVLLYGPPGTGKTQLCKVLSERLGVTLYSVGESTDNDDEPSRNDRLQELRLSQRLLARERRSLVLFDEMEDLLSEPFADHAFFRRPSGSRPNGGGSKVFMHRLLERAPTPTLWTMNDGRGVSPAILRRMMFALELRPPTTRIRARIWARQLDRHGIEVEPEEARSLAAEFDATPGVATAATAAARLGGGDIDTVRRGVRSLSRVLSYARPPQRVPARFDLCLIRADTDPVALADHLARKADGKFSLCLQGPPGTGKSAYVRYLAERLDLEVMQKRASDLASMWVGETEQRIAAAFAEAHDTGGFLVFDEADSLLADRRLAERTWEVSQVNEMLTWMESHPLPFACTTNFAEHLDPATLRRFVFKVTLDYLTPAQAETAFWAYFALAPPAELAALTALTPGDFALVRRKAELLDRLQEPEALVTMLRTECEAKPRRPRPVGFRP